MLRNECRHIAHLSCDDCDDGTIPDLLALPIECGPVRFASRARCWNATGDTRAALEFANASDDHGFTRHFTFEVSDADPQFVRVIVRPGHYYTAATLGLDVDPFADDRVCAVLSVAIPTAAAASVARRAYPGGA